MQPPLLCPILGPMQDCLIVSAFVWLREFKPARRIGSEEVCDTLTSRVGRYSRLSSRDPTKAACRRFPSMNGSRRSIVPAGGNEAYSKPWKIWPTSSCDRSGRRRQCACARRRADSATGRQRIIAGPPNLRRTRPRVEERCRRAGSSPMPTAGSLRRPDVHRCVGGAGVRRRGGCGAAHHSARHAARGARGILWGRAL